MSAEALLLKPAEEEYLSSEHVNHLTPLKASLQNLYEPIFIRSGNKLFIITTIQLDISSAMSHYFYSLTQHSKTAGHNE